MTRSESKQAMLDELGVVPVVADARLIRIRSRRLGWLSTEARTPFGFRID
jgi:hypothetical protein